MKIYDSFGPNPRALRMFLHEKGLTIPSSEVNLFEAENRRPPYSERVGLLHQVLSASTTSGLVVNLILIYVGVRRPIASQ